MDAVVERAAYSRVPSRTRGLTRATYASLTVYGVAFVWATAFAFLAVGRHDRFLSHRFDLGNMTQALWSTANGRWLETTAGNGEQISRLAAHVDPILVLVAPLWWLWPSPALLVTLQAGAFAAGAVPVHWLARKHIASAWAAAALPVAYLLYPSLQWNALGDFHPVAFAVPLLLFAIWFLDEHRLGSFAIVAVLALLTKEQIGLVVAGLGVWYALSRGRPRAGAAIVLTGVAWTTVAVLAVVPHFAGGASPYFSRYESVGGSPAGMARTLVADPGALVAAATTASDARFAFSLAVPLAGVFVLSPLLALAAAPELLLDLLSDFEPMSRMQNHYVSGIVPFLTAGTVLGVARCRRPQRAAVCVLVAAALSAVVLGPPAAFDTYGAETAPSASRRAALDAAVAFPPADAPVSTTNDLGAHLSERERVFSFPVVAEARWIVLDTRDPWFPSSDDEVRRPREFSLAADRIRRDPRWVRVFEREGVVVFRKSSLS